MEAANGRCGYAMNVERDVYRAYRVYVGRRMRRLRVSLRFIDRSVEEEVKSTVEYLVKCYRSPVYDIASPDLTSIKMYHLPRNTCRSTWEDELFASADISSSLRLDFTMETP